MARQQSYGYLAISTTKYGGSPYYGGRRSGNDGIDFWWLYGTNLPPPQPSNLTIEYYPKTSDSTPYFSWFAQPLETEDLFFQIQIKLDSSDFSSPTIDIGPFTATDLTTPYWYTYEIPYSERLTVDGAYYARIRSSDGYTWSDWSSTISFEYFSASPSTPTIDPVTSPTDNFVQIITGGKTPSSRVYIRINDSDWEEVEYPYGIPGVTWSYTATLEAGMNTIEVISGWTESYTLGVSSPAFAYIHTIFETLEPFNVWNCFDEMGMLVSLERNLGEKNKSYKERILDVYINPGGSNYQGLINAISRELGIGQSEVIIYRLSDLSDESSDDNILNSDGNAIGTKLEEYVDEVYDHNPIFWGNIVADEGVWDAIDEDYSGLSYLPHLWDPTASGILSKWQKTGIGDQDDLYTKEVVSEADEDFLVLADPVEEGMLTFEGSPAEMKKWRLPVHTGYFYIKE